MIFLLSYRGPEFLYFRCKGPDIDGFFSKKKKKKKKITNFIQNLYLSILDFFLGKKTSILDACIYGNC